MSHYTQDLKTHPHISPDYILLTFTTQMADENMVQNAVTPTENHQNGDEDEWDEKENDENVNEAEFEAINAQLDQLNSALDNLEQKNDDIQAELIELLKSNREARKQFKECQNKVNTNPPNSAEK